MNLKVNAHVRHIGDGPLSGKAGVVTMLKYFDGDDIGILTEMRHESDQKEETLNAHPYRIGDYALVTWFDCKTMNWVWASSLKVID